MHIKLQNNILVSNSVLFYIRLNGENLHFPLCPSCKCLFAHYLIRYKRMNPSLHSLNYELPQTFFWNSNFCYCFNLNSSLPLVKIDIFPLVHFLHMSVSIIWFAVIKWGLHLILDSVGRSARCGRKLQFFIRNGGTRNDLLISA